MRICDRCDARIKEVYPIKIIIGTPTDEDDMPVGDVDMQKTIDLCDHCLDRLIESVEEFVRPMPKEGK